MSPLSNLTFQFPECGFQKSSFKRFCNLENLTPLEPHIESFGKFYLLILDPRRLDIRRYLQTKDSLQFDW